MNRRTRKLLAQAGSFLLGGGLLYLALRNVDLSEIRQALIEADYRYVFPLVCVVIVSHLLRAWRWVIMLDALPQHPHDSGHRRRHSLRIAFYSLIIGYMVNYAAPRMGEIARSANVAAQEKTRFSSVFGTVVAERVLDLACLGVALVSVLLLFRDQIFALDIVSREAINAYVERMQFEYIAAGLLILLLVLVTSALAWRFFQRRKDKRSKIIRQRLKISLNAFRSGLVTLFRSRRPVAITVSTVLMWICYLYMAYIPFAMLGMTDAYNITLVSAWAVMVVGSLGVVIPSPGGIGSYHYITIQTLVLLFAVSETPAASYAVLTHAAQLILYTLLGFTFLQLQGANLKSLTESKHAAESGIS